jgi:hypothetical protein
LPASVVLEGETYQLVEGRFPHYRHVAPFGGRREVRFDSAAKAAFIEAIADGLNVERAAQRAGFAVPTAYRHLNRDACFAAS